MQPRKWLDSLQMIWPQRYIFCRDKVRRRAFSVFRHDARLVLSDCISPQLCTIGGFSDYRDDGLVLAFNSGFDNLPQQITFVADLFSCLLTPGLPNLVHAHRATLSRSFGEFDNTTSLPRLSIKRPPCYKPSLFLKSDLLRSFLCGASSI